jgi:hypothetical protein
LDKLVDLFSGSADRHACGRGILFTFSGIKECLVRKTESSGLIAMHF